MTRSVDALDLKIAEVEAKVVTEIRRLIVQECLNGCRTNQPWCPHLRSSELCPSIRRVLQEEVPTILREMNGRN